MPNYVRNILTVDKNAKEIHKLCNTKYTEFDFSSIIPEAYKNDDEWYEWRVKNWGTKWNSLDAKFDEQMNMFTFDTAWAAPVPVINKLSKLFPDTEFNLIWADELLGDNCGDMTIKDGETINEFYPEYEEQMIELYKRCWNCEPDEGIHPDICDQD